MIVIRRLSQVFISDLTKELDVLKYSDDTVYLYHYRVLPYFMLVPLRNVGFFNIQKNQFFVLENEIFSKNIVV